MTRATAAALEPEVTRILQMAIPIIIGGMSNGGALRKKAKIALVRAA